MLESNRTCELLAMSSLPDMRTEHMLEEVSEKAMRVARAGGAGILLYEGSADDWEISEWASSGSLTGVTLARMREVDHLENHPLAVVSRSGRPFEWRAGRDDSWPLPLPPRGNTLFAPLLERGRVRGILVVSLVEGESWTETRIAALEQLAARALPAIERAVLRDRLREAGAPSDILGVSETFLDYERRLRLAGRFSRGAVLITGERGSGKELAAWSIHCLSKRNGQAMIPVLAPALSDSLFASELFGHERNAFTGADRPREGKFLAARGGTLFLDEVGDLPAQFQASLLRILETGELQRVGSDEPIKVDVRVVVATNLDLETLIEEGRFRHDLYDRLKVFELALPPLRERREDIPLLAQHFLRLNCERSWRRPIFEREHHCPGCRGLGCSVPCVTPQFFSALQAYDWPGNVRELKNFIVRLMANHPEEVFDVHLLPEPIRAAASVNGAPPRGTAASAPRPMDLRLESAIRQHISSVLDHAEGNQSQAARLLGLPLSTLRSKMKKLGIDASASMS